MIGTEPPKPDAGMKILTPCWDLLKRYLTAGIMTIALSTVALQAAKDQLVCIPAVKCKGAEAATASPTDITQDLRSTNTCKEVLEKLQNDSWKEVMTTMVDRRQYDFVDSLCYQNSLGWYPTYFPFILVAMAAILLVIDNIWVMYPKTSSTLNHFVSLTMECYNSDGTNSDIFHILSKYKRDSKDGESDMKVKTLHDKVKQFTNYFDEKRLLIRVYKIQAALEMLISFGFLVFVSVCFAHLEKSIECRLDNVFNTPYQYFVCARFITPYYQAATVIFGVAIALFFMLSAYTLYWTLRHDYMTNIHSEQAVDNNVNIKGDVAFLFSLLEQYNKLYFDRLTDILSRGHKQTLPNQTHHQEERENQRSGGSGILEMRPMIEDDKSL